MSTLLPISFEKQLRWTFSAGFWSATAILSKDEVKLILLKLVGRAALFAASSSSSTAFLTHSMEDVKLWRFSNLTGFKLTFSPSSSTDGLRRCGGFDRRFWCLFRRRRGERFLRVGLLLLELVKGAFDTVVFFVTALEFGFSQNSLARDGRCPLLPPDPHGRRRDGCLFLLPHWDRLETDLLHLEHALFALDHRRFLEANVAEFHRRF